MATSSKILYLASGINRSLDLLSSSNSLQIRDSALKISRDAAATVLLSVDVQALTTGRSITFPDANINFGAFARTLIAAGSANHVVVNDGSGNLSSEAALAASRGGLGTSATAFSGVVKAVAGVFSASAVVDADVSASAAIALSKLAALTASRALVSSGAGVVSVSSVTAVELDHVSGVTTPIQTQIDSRLALAGGTMSGAIAMGSFKITGLAEPTVASDAATKNYVDNAISGLSWKSPARVATTADITLSGLQTIDGISALAGNRVLVKDQTTASQNGIYLVASGSWTRTLDMDSLSPLDEVTGAAIFIMEGTVNASRGYVQTAAVVTFPGDALAFVQFSAAGAFAAGNGIAITGNTISVALAATPGLEFSSSALRIRLADTSLALSAGGVAVSLASGSGLQISSGLSIRLEASNPSLQIASGELGAKLNAAGSIVSDASGLAVQLEASNASLQISSNRLGVKFDSAKGLQSGALGLEVRVDASTIVFNSSGQLTVSSSDAVLISFTAGENLLAGDAVYVSAAGTVSKARANSETTSIAFIGIARSTVSSGAPVQVCVAGRVSGLSALSAGSRYYVSAATAGVITTTAPSAIGDQVVLACIAMSATEVVLNPTFLASID